MNNDANKWMVIVVILAALNIVLYIVSNTLVHIQYWKLFITGTQVIISIVQVIFVCVYLRKRP